MINWGASKKTFQLENSFALLRKKSEIKATCSADANLHAVYGVALT